MGHLKGKSALMIFDRNPEYRNQGNRHFWAKGYYVDTFLLYPLLVYHTSLSYDI